MLEGSCSASRYFLCLVTSQTFQFLPLSPVLCLRHYFAKVSDWHTCARKWQKFPASSQRWAAFNRRVLVCFFVCLFLVFFLFRRRYLSGPFDSPISKCHYNFVILVSQSMSWQYHEIYSKSSACRQVYSTERKIQKLHQSQLVNILQNWSRIVLYTLSRKIQISILGGTMSMVIKDTSK